MFNFFKKKNKFPTYKEYTFHYHLVCQPDNKTATFNKCLTWIDAVNKLHDIERNAWIYIDYVNVRDVE